MSRTKFDGQSKLNLLSRLSCFNGFESQRGVTAWRDRGIILLTLEELMKRKLKKSYIFKINELRSRTKGWPLWMVVADNHPRYHAELRHYKQLDSYCRSKAGRLDGSYEFHFGKKPARIALGN